MKLAPGDPVQRVCPRCSGVATTADRNCPWCGASYRRRLWPALLVTALVSIAVTLGGTAYMLTIFGDELRDTLDDEVEQVQGDIDTSFGQVRRDVREELDRRLPEPQTTP